MAPVRAVFPGLPRASAPRNAASFPVRDQAVSANTRTAFRAISERIADLACPLASSSRFFETFSFLPPLSDQEIARQVQYLLNNGWTPCIEFESAEKAYCDSHGWTGIDTSVNAGYYDNRYWVMWKLPMYGCQNPDEVIAEINTCIKCFPGMLRPRRWLRQHQASAMLRVLGSPPGVRSCVRR